MSVKKIEIDIPQEYQNEKLNNFLKAIFPNASFFHLQKLIRKKDIKVNGKKTEGNYRIELNDIVEIPEFIYEGLLAQKSQVQERSSHQQKRKISANTISEFKKNIVYKDDKIIAINKPRGLAVQGGSNIKICVADFLPYLKFGNEQTPQLVHRIDKDTSGLLLIARNSSVSKTLTSFFRQKDQIQKIYLAIVVGQLPKNNGTISYPLTKKFSGGIEKVYKDSEHGKEAITIFKVLSYSKRYNVSLVEVKILTGRTHQIRVHFKEFGHPILGDGKYGGKKAFVEGLSNKIHLHAYKMFIKEMNLKLKADFPQEFLNTIRKSGLKVK